MRTDFSDNTLIQRCIEFSLQAIEYVELLEHERKFVIARQLLKSATSVGTNAMEAQSAESKADLFITLRSQIKKHLKRYTGFSCANTPILIHLIHH